MIFIAELIAKSCSYILKKLFRQGGETWPGEIILFIFPNILTELKSYFSDTIFIVGTNGKTSTNKLISEVLTNKGINLITNPSGANLLNGIVSNILIKKKFFGKEKYVGVFELDEYAFSQITNHLEPTYIIFLNVFRDQLDRYGEVSNVLDRWNKVLTTLKQTKVIINASDPGLVFLTKNMKTSNVEYYSVPTSYLHNQQNTFGDSNYCYKCGSKLNYKSCYLAHLGNWHCSKCNVKQPKGFEFKQEVLKKFVNMPQYVLINAEAVYLLSKHFKISDHSFFQTLNKFKSAFGRGETLNIKNIDYSFYLGKNPASWTATMDYLKDKISDLSLLILGLNNKIPDGHDVSWIWDISISHIFRNINKNTKVVVFGDRCFDMVLRLKAEGIKTDLVLYRPDLLKKEISKYKPKKVIILANYSALLEARQQIIGRAIL